MREITIQVVLKLREATDAQVRDVEVNARDWANDQLIFTDETASVAILMDRELDPLAKIDRLTRALVSVPKDDDEAAEREERRQHREWRNDSGV